MDGGKLVSHGTYDELIQKCEYFRKICEIKFGEIFENDVLPVTHSGKLDVVDIWNDMDEIME